jgi:D-alanyl-lipoteichoic acid acyltransferase DltB (MBOAT superfamily)
LEDSIVLFNSLEFGIFLPIVFAIYWILPHKYRWVLLLTSSYYFYMSWNAKYIFLILFTTFVSYAAGILLERETDKSKKKLILAASLVICLGILFVFKYFNFAFELISDVLSVFTIKLNPLTVNLLLPVGISFYTFQTLSYVIDVYRGSVKAEHHFGYYAAFISFFPQLVAGPIERTSNLLPQIKAEHKFDYSQATYGLKLMAWGYFKKIVVADTLSQYVSKVYDVPQQFQGFALVIATLFFSIQIYCDFSGYSDIAIGTSKLLGINLMTNFKSPYFSQSIKEFWGRWHISLSTWFRDYVYIPLGGNRVGKVRHAFNLIVTFLLSGIWHGANLTFIVWGLLHGFAQVLENILIPKKYVNNKSGGVLSWLRIAIVFAFCTFAWIFFVSNSCSDAVYVITQAFVGISNPAQYIRKGVNVMHLGLHKKELLVVGLLILTLGVYDFASLKIDVIEWIGKRNIIVRWICYVILIYAIILLSQIGDSTFIYFQF